MCRCMVLSRKKDYRWSGRCNLADWPVRASLRLLEEHEQRVEALRSALVEGEQSGDAGELNMDEIKRAARRAGPSPSNA